MSEWTVNGVVIPCWVASRPARLPLTSPARLYVHGVFTPSQPVGDGSEPTKWSPSSTVNTKSVFFFVIPSCLRRSKNWPNAVS